MKTMTLQVPENTDEQEAKLFLAAKLYERGSLTLGQAAEVAGMPKRSFMEQLYKYNVSVFDFTPAGLERDLAKSKRYYH